MERRTAYLHLGLAHSGASSLDGALETHRAALAARGVRRPGTPDAAFRAAVELGWQHRAWGYRRREVEGAWAAVCRQARKDRRRTRAVVVSQQLVAPLRREQVDLCLDGLAGFRTYLVVTVAAPGNWARAGDPAHDLVEVLARWAPAVGDPERVHVLVAPRTDRRRALWSAFCELLGVDADDLPLPEPAGGLPAPAPAPVAVERHAELTRLALTWVGALATSGYDVRGDLADLLPAASSASVRLPGVLVGRP